MTASIKRGGARGIAPPPSRIAIRNDVEPGDWREVYRKMDASSADGAILLFHVASAVATLAGLFAAVGLAAGIATWAEPAISTVYLACLILPPGFLVGAAAGQAGGNLFLRLRHRIDDETRRGFAMRLTLARAPASWPNHVKRWLFTGDWLTPPVYDARLPYVRIFVDGPAPATCRAEDELWREIHENISRDGLWEAGMNHREISYPAQLPGWARKVGRGDGAAELEDRIGAETARDWIEHLWRRAARQCPLLGPREFPAAAGREIFESHHIRLTGGREALVVVLRPSCFAPKAHVRERSSGEDLAA